MSDIAISVENISKRYRIGTVGGPSYHRLSEMITGVPRTLWNFGRTVFRSPKLDPEGAESSNKNDFWALKDVSFEVKQGEVVGIIGRNGAGKSTLLKILSRITEPTSGRFGIRGRVASLLEVGTGFHPELTGRENIYVSGITLGMTRAEIKKRFDEIVDFSGVARFLDTPVKHYSSGMQVRLGFAVAAYLESEILIIDEVLAVGDAEFQNRCRQRISEISNSGRCILLVTHHLQTAKTLCERVIRLEKGRIGDIGDSTLICQQYLAKAADPSGATDLSNAHARQGSGIATFAAVSLLDESNARIDSVTNDAPFRIEFTLDCARACQVEIAVGLDDALNRRLVHLSSGMTRASLITATAGRTKVLLNVDLLPLHPGDYSLTLFLTANAEISDWVRGAVLLSVRPTQSTGDVPSLEQGPVQVRHRFALPQQSATSFASQN
jgi:lipopolysaccharide transport system ATP-binding protein